MRVKLFAVLVGVLATLAAPAAFADYPDDCLGSQQSSGGDCGDIGYEGCCDNLGRAVWCDAGQVFCIDCAGLNPECGWQGQFYDCGTDGSGDPSGAFPKDCISCDPACKEGEWCDAGTCKKCSCDGKQCGTDGCGNSCGDCGENAKCEKGQCVACSCNGKECGADNCGKPCGTCKDGKGCDATGKCVTAPVHCVPKAEAGCPGCACEKCVCDLDSFCCSTAWDSLCVGECVNDCKGDACPEGLCFPMCDGAVCGSDGCGGTCGTCTDPKAVCVAGECCVPSCTGKVCGDDGCGGTCGQCGEGTFCDPTGQCKACSCTGKECGADECGKPCGTCKDGKGCDATGKCVTAEPHCVTKNVPGCPGCACEACVCELDSFCCDTAWDGLCVGECVNDCGGPACPEGLCFPMCEGFVCGSDGCGGTCGTCKDPAVCFEGNCCTPSCAGKECGDDGCGGECAKCAAGNYCDNFKCVACSCEGKECGDDGCGNSCGDCGEGACVDGKCNNMPGCVTLGTPTCGGCPCEACVCELDPYCCETAWDGICVGECINDCGGCPELKNCGDGKCQTEEFENCSTCAGDCACADGESCFKGACCTPSCEGKECGDDGCGGSCGTCEAGFGCKEGTCVESTGPAECLGPNEPSSDDCMGLTYEGCCDDLGRVMWCDGDKLFCIDCATVNPQCGWQGEFYDCGTDGSADPSGASPKECAGGCNPPCGKGQKCVGGECVACEPSCDGKSCGDDGCGGSCGSCPADAQCIAGACHGGPGCVATPGTTGCGGCGCEECVCAADAYCCDTEWDDVCVGECINDCGGCPVESVPNCGNGACDAGEDCGNCADDCGCKDGEVCNAGACCAPACDGLECGDDGCGGSCGTCETGECVEGKCACTPACDGKECGDDGCGGSCGTCEAGECVEGKCACTPKCDGLECGDDGCGGTCGTCDEGSACTEKGICEPTAPVDDVISGDVPVSEEDVGTEQPPKKKKSGCSASDTASPVAGLLLLALLAALVPLRRFSAR